VGLCLPVAGVSAASRRGRISTVVAAGGRLERGSSQLPRMPLVPRMPLESLVSLVVMAREVVARVVVVGIVMHALRLPAGEDGMGNEWPRRDETETEMPLLFVSHISPAKCLRYQSAPAAVPFRLGVAVYGSGFRHFIIKSLSQRQHLILLLLIEATRL